MTYGDKSSADLAIIAVNTVHNIIVKGMTKLVEHFLNVCNDNFEISAIAWGPGLLRFYGMKIRRCKKLNMIMLLNK